MRCPENIANALLEILSNSLLCVRSYGWSRRADRCAIEADHVHNIPQLLRDFRPELLEYYWTVERPAYIRQSAAEETAVYEAAWNALRASMAGRVEVGLPLSPLELAIVDLVATQNWPGFRVEHVRISRREDTGVGRYVYFEDGGDQTLVDGSYAAGYQHVEMEGIRHGLFFVIEVDGSRIDYLEMVTCGDDTWDGVERPWRIV